MSTDAPQAEARQPAVADDELENLAERVDRAITDIQALKPEIRSKAMALKSATEEFHKAGLTHIVKTLKNDPGGKQLLFDLVDEPTVYALFVMHRLVRGTVCSSTVNRANASRLRNANWNHFRFASRTIASSCDRDQSRYGIGHQTCISHSNRQHLDRRAAIKRPCARGASTWLGAAEVVVGGNIGVRVGTP